MKKVDCFNFFFCLNICKNEYLLSKKQRKIIRTSQRILRRKNQERLKEQSKNKYKELPKEQRNIKREYVRNR